MRKMYDEYFCVPEQGKGVVGEKVFISRLIVSIVCIVICMFAMGYNAYAFFTASVGSSANILQAAIFDIEVQVQSTVSDTGTVVNLNQETRTYSLAAGTYQFTFKVSENSSVSTGYCKIEVNKQLVQGVEQYETTFYTQQFFTVSGSNTPVMERTVLISVDRETEIRITPCWGTYSGAGTNTETYLIDNDAISVKNNLITKKDVSSITAPVSTTPNNNGNQTPTPQESVQQPTNENVDTNTESFLEEKTEDVQENIEHNSEEGELVAE